MIDIKNLCIAPNITIKESMRVIEAGTYKIALVVDAHHKLKGVLTDGDIRRALLEGYRISDSIESIYNKSPVVSYEADSNDILVRKSIAGGTYQIPIIDSNDKLVGLKELSNLLSMQTINHKVVIMAGGLGTRLHPLTEKNPKPLLTVGGKPILETIINTFSENSFKEFIISVNYKADMIKSYFGDGKKFGVNIQYIDESKRMGTAGSLSFMKNQLTESFFVINADLLTNLNYNYMLQYHLAHEAEATMGTVEYKIEIPYGVIHTINQQIVDIEEKPTHKFLVSGGIYVLHPSILDMIPENSFFDMPTLFEQLITKNKKVISFSIRDRDYWKDIGSIDDYECANEEYKNNFS